MRFLNRVKCKNINIDLTGDYLNRQDFKWEWNKKYVKPISQTEIVGEFAVNEYISPEDFEIYNAVNGNMDEFKSVKAYLEHPGDALYPAPEDSVFRKDDLRVALRDHRYDYKKIKKPIQVKVPIIKHCNPDAIRPPLFVTTSWYCDKVNKKVIHNAINEKLDKVDIMELMIERDSIRDKLGMLDRNKPKDAKRILKLNCRLRDINEQIKWLESACGEEQEIDYGSKLGRAYQRIKNINKVAYKDLGKGIKKALNNIGDFFNFDDKTWAVIGQACVVILVGVATKKFGKLAMLIFG